MMARVQAANAVQGEAARHGIHLVTREEMETLALVPPPRRFRLRPRNVDAEGPVRDIVHESPWLLISVVALTVPLTWFLHQLMHRIGI